MNQKLQAMIDKWRRNPRAMHRIVQASGGNLSDADLSYADLSGADLSDADLSYADLSYADLSDANLSNADLSDADLSDADLIDADLIDADLSYADLIGANLSNSDLSNADLRDANLREANLREANLNGAIIDLPVSMSTRKARPALIVGRDEWVLRCWEGTTAATIERIVSEKTTSQALSYLASMYALACDEALCATPDMQRQLREAIRELEAVEKNRG